MKIISLLFIVCSVNFSFAAPSSGLKVSKTVAIDDSTNVAPDISEELINTIAENKPQFPGGKHALKEFFKSNINYENVGDYGNLTTNAHLAFVVQRDGRVSNFLVRGGDGGEIDAELIRVMKLMPLWKAATDKLGNELHFRYLITIDLNFPGEGDEIIMYTAPPEDEIEEKKNADSQPVVDFAEVSPEFPNGHNAMQQFIQNNLETSQIASQFQENGTVFIQFTVMKTGEITDIIVRRGLNQALDEEAIRLVKLMPKWNPAKQGEKTVNCRYTLPINFHF